MVAATWVNRPMQQQDADAGQQSSAQKNSLYSS